jgi:hypothetical protein
MHETHRFQVHPGQSLSGGFHPSRLAHDNGKFFLQLCISSLKELAPALIYAVHVKRRFLATHT